jgi:hypothetical protein
MCYYEGLGWQKTVTKKTFSSDCNLLFEYLRSWKFSWFESYNGCLDYTNANNSDLSGGSVLDRPCRNFNNQSPDDNFFGKMLEQLITYSLT